MPWAVDDARPLVLVSFSTGPYWDQASRIRRTVQALADVDCRVLVTTGSADVSDMAETSNVLLIRYVAHAEVLPHAAITVTHAGHGTVAASLAHAVPMVCLPNPAADQPALAARVEKLGVGIALDGENATATDIAAAVRQVLAHASYAAAARRLAKTIAATPGAAMAVRRLEELAQPTPQSSMTKR
jgi:MGT family glycosyltransferase